MLGSSIKNAVDVFWHDFYTDPKKGYTHYARTHHKDDKDPMHAFLDEANRRVSLIDKTGIKIKELIDIITRSIATFAGDAEITKLIKRDLISNLSACMQRIANVDQVELDAIKRLSTQKIQPPTVIVEQPSYFMAEKIEPYIVRFPLVNVPIYQQAKSRLLDNAVFPQDLSLMKLPARFYTPTQELIYHKFLVPYHGVVNAMFMFSVFYGVSWGHIDSLRELYSHLNAIMSGISAPRSVDGYTLCPLLAGAVIEKNKLYISVVNDSIEYQVRDRDDGGVYKGVIPITELMVDPKLPVTFDVLQSYIFEILEITSKRGHTYTAPATIPRDDEKDIFFQLHKSGHQKAQFFWNTELELIDQCCKIALHRYAQKSNEKTYNILATDADFKILEINIVDQDIEISIDKHLLSYAGGAFAVELENTEQNLAREKQAHEALQLVHKATLVELDGVQAKLDGVAADSVKKDDLISSQQGDINRQKQLIDQLFSMLKTSQASQPGPEAMLLNLQGFFAAGVVNVSATPSADLASTVMESSV